LEREGKTTENKMGAVYYRLLLLLSTAVLLSSCDLLDVHQPSAADKTDSSKSEAAVKQLQAALLAELYSQALINDQAHRHAYLAHDSAPLGSSLADYSASRDDLTANQKSALPLKRFSEFLGGKRKRFSEFLGGKKRFSEFLGGKKRAMEREEEMDKRFSEFLGGKRGAQTNQLIKEADANDVYDQQMVDF